MTPTKCKKKFNANRSQYVDEVKWALMNKFMNLECSYVLKVAAVCNLWSLISSVQQINKSYLMEGSQTSYVREHRPTAALHVLYIKSRLPPNASTQSRTHGSAVWDDCVSHCTPNTIQIHSCTCAEKQSVVKPFYLTAAPKRLQSYLLLFIINMHFFRHARTLGGLKG